MFDLYVKIIENYILNIWELLFFLFLIAIFSWIISDLIYRLKNR